MFSDESKNKEDELVLAYYDLRKVYKKPVLTSFDVMDVQGGRGTVPENTNGSIFS